MSSTSLSHMEEYVDCSRPSCRAFEEVKTDTADEFPLDASTPPVPEPEPESAPESTDSPETSATPGPSDIGVQIRC